MADLKGVGGKATVIRIYYENKIYFKLKKNRKNIKLEKKSQSGASGGDKLRMVMCDVITPYGKRWGQTGGGAH